LHLAKTARCLLTATFIDDSLTSAIKYLQNDVQLHNGSTAQQPRTL